MPTPASVPTSSETSLQRPIGSGLPRVGEWLWACRTGFESDLCDELASQRASGRMIEPGLVASSKSPSSELVFARQGLPVQAAWVVTDRDQLGSAIDKDAPIVTRIVSEIVKALGDKGLKRPLA